MFFVEKCVGFCQNPSFGEKSRNKYSTEAVDKDMKWRAVVEIPGWLGETATTATWYASVTVSVQADTAEEALKLISDGLKMVAWEDNT